MAVEHGGTRGHLENLYAIALDRCPVLDEERRTECDFAVEAARRLGYRANRESWVQSLGMTLLSIRLVAGDSKFVVLFFSARGRSFLVPGCAGLCASRTGGFFVFSGRVEGYLPQALGYLSDQI